MNAYETSSCPTAKSTGDAAPNAYRVVVFGHVDDPAIVKQILAEFAGVPPEDTRPSSGSPYAVRRPSAYNEYSNNR
jgi:hypothetical protein